MDSSTTCRGTGELIIIKLHANFVKRERSVSMGGGGRLHHLRGHTASIMSVTGVTQGFCFCSEQNKPNHRGLNRWVCFRDKLTGSVHPGVRAQSYVTACKSSPTSSPSRSAAFRTDAIVFCCSLTFKVQLLSEELRKTSS